MVFRLHPLSLKRQLSLTAVFKLSLETCTFSKPQNRNGGPVHKFSSLLAHRIQQQGGVVSKEGAGGGVEGECEVVEGLMLGDIAFISRKIKGDLIDKQLPRYTRTRATVG